MLAFYVLGSEYPWHRTLSERSKALVQLRSVFTSTYINNSLSGSQRDSGDSGQKKRRKKNVDRNEDEEEEPWKICVLHRYRYVFVRQFFRRLCQRQCLRHLPRVNSMWCLFFPILSFASFLLLFFLSLLFVSAHSFTVLPTPKFLFRLFFRFHLLSSFFVSFWFRFILPFGLHTFCIFSLFWIVKSDFISAKWKLFSLLSFSLPSSSSCFFIFVVPFFSVLRYSSSLSSLSTPTHFSYTKLRHDKEILFKFILKASQMTKLSSPKAINNGKSIETHSAYERDENEIGEKKTTYKVNVCNYFHSRNANVE